MITPAQWSPVAIKLLEPGAKAAITAFHGNSMVIANPGSGKTELLAQRADFVLRTGTSRYPKKILAISFKTDAAHTLRRRVRDRSGFDHAHRLNSMTFDAFARRIIAIYRPLLKPKDRLDHGFKVGVNRVDTIQVAFKELVPLAQQLIEQHPMIKRSINMAYSHVFLDEFQDCTSAQYKLIHTLFKDTPTSITAVGDAKQKIMGWAGALDGVMGKFADEFPAVVLRLVQNWRSAPAIRRVQNRMISQMEPESAVAESDIVGEEGKVYLARFANEQAEATRIAEKIEEWIAEGIAPHEIAILHIRQSAMFNQAIDCELDRLNIPRRNEQELQDLVSEPVTEFVVNILRVLGHKPAPSAYTSLLYVLTAQDDGEQGDWVRLLSAARDRVAQGPAHDRAEIAFKQLQEVMALIPIATLLSLSAEYDAARIAEILGQVYEVLGRFIGQHHDLDQALARFLDEGSVRVMTIHKCKGMEFECVVLPCTEQETWWGDRDENRNAYFVGVSRAKQNLVVTYADRRSKPTQASSRWETTRRPQEEFIGYVQAGALPL
ncbi:ATP-dependent helicase [Xanthomonas vasicola]|uniref:DNA 3'-5' helicase n=1 Tax=Xanthomonas vasicola pv. vasculorum NCPPB 890 TaxID=1184265 RepID=A0A836ZTN1_XANVA|nr:ATP-dependent helicase [Xanthomonas vasicola]KFA28672.1 DNA helicase UvrD [Xanthomonas vasicola pv. vasculorum NCPPB 1326]KFA35316.1 DNA helicase UvrD [Xanthomonas vasicola pv. vasculorum NCPPB 1381]MBV6748587.1 ATP-dependent helicase [Xanthomonas vasicola pv. vasculorum NCPPB 890]MBV6894262.1 ATP-dependent helicase [Xanthomonas vasicola pv. vasculorum]MDO6950113.1 ATP-dependent helicase [Xanthomonas vasicola]